MCEKRRVCAGSRATVVVAGLVCVLLASPGDAYVFSPMLHLRGRSHESFAAGVCRQTGMAGQFPGCATKVKQTPAAAVRNSLSQHVCARVVAVR
jgi:hypothetical protein